MRVRTHIVYDDDLSRESTVRKQFMASGMFYSNKSTDPINLNLHVAPGCKRLRMSKGNMNRLFFLVSQIIQHESIHKRQTRYCPDTSLHVKPAKVSKRLSSARAKEISYLSSPDELEAYANDVALEIRSYYPDMPLQEVFAKIDSLRHMVSFGFYLKAFRGIEWARIRKTLLRRVWKIYPTTVPVFRIETERAS